MTAYDALAQIPSNLAKTEDLNQNLLNFSFSIAENNAEYSKKMHQELVDGLGQIVAEFNNPEQLSQVMIKMATTTGETATKYLMNYADLIQQAQKETLNIYLRQNEVEAAPEVTEATQPELKTPVSKAKKSQKQTAPRA